MKPKVFIAMPTTNNSVKLPAAASIIRTVVELERGGIQATFEAIDGASVVGARDNLAHSFLASDCTHLFFVDSDMMFKPDLCGKLLATNKPCIGAAYATRFLDLNKVKVLIEQGETLERAMLRTYIFNVRFEDGNKAVLEGRLCSVAGLGMGLILIARECLTKLLQEGNLPLSKTRLRGRERETRRPSFFTEIGDMTEDFSFCERYRQIGGEVWAYMDADIRHVGDFDYGAPFALKLETMLTAQGAKPSPPAS